MEKTKQEKVQASTPEPKKPSKLFTDYYGSVILLLIALLVAGGFFVIKPKIDEYKAAKANTEFIRLQANDENNYLEAISRSVAAAQVVSPDVLQKTERALPQAASIPDVLVQMEQAAAASNVKLKNISFDAGDKKQAASQGIKPLNITLMLDARDYGSIRRFLTLLEYSLRLMDVQAINASGFGQEQVNFSVQIRTYYYPSK